jgi:hypothetical protein
MNIEIGKQYIIKGHLYAPNNGLIVTVTGYFGEKVPNGIGGVYLGKRWTIDVLLADTRRGNPVGLSINHINQDYLHPLDNNTKFEAGSWDALKDILTPSKLATNHKEALTNAN